MLKMTQSSFKRFLIKNLKHGQQGFDDYVYNFDQYLMEAMTALERGDDTYVLQSYETKKGKSVVFNFEEESI